MFKESPWYMIRLPTFCNLQEVFEGLEKANDVAEAINAEELLFGMPLTKFPQIQVLTSQLDPLYKLWSIADLFKVNEEIWMTAKLNSLDIEKIEGEVNSPPVFRHQKSHMEKRKRKNSFLYNNHESSTIDLSFFFFFFSFLKIGLGIHL